MKVAVVQGSLTDGDAELLVNASNTNARLGSGVSAAIRAACGPGYQEHISAALERTFGGPMEPGHVLLTDAGSHPRARFVAHVAVMDYRDGSTGRSYPTLALIERCCANLVLAIESLHEPVSVAMVALGGGTGQLGVREPTRIACETFAEYSRERGRSAKISSCTFYGFTFIEYAAVADVVTRTFPEVLATVSAEARSLFQPE